MAVRDPQADIGPIPRYSFEKARFVFVSDDADEQGNLDDIMHNGAVVRDARFGVLLEIDDTGFYWRSELSD